jgi:hypothetical protein
VAASLRRIAAVPGDTDPPSRIHACMRCGDACRPHHSATIRLPSTAIIP